MNLQAARVVLRPRTQSEIFDLAARFCVGLGGGLYLKLGLWLLLPCLAVCAVAWLATASWPLVWTIALMLAALVEGAFTVAASRLLFEARPGVGSVLAQFARRLPAYCAVLLLLTIFYTVGSLMIVLGLLAWFFYLFVPEALLLEGQGPLRSLGRARVLVRRKFGVALGVRLGTLVAQLFAIFAADALLGAGLCEFVLQLGEPLGDLGDDGGSAFALLGLFVAVPYAATVRFLTYIDGRTRQDGWDIQIRFAAIAAADAGSRAPATQEAA